MVELVDTRDLKSLGHYGRAGSSPALRTKENSSEYRAVFFGVYCHFESLAKNNAAQSLACVLFT